MEIEPKNNGRLQRSIPNRRPPSSMRAAIASRHVMIGGSVGRFHSREETPSDGLPFDVSRHRVNISTKGGQEPVRPPYIGEPDTIKDINGEDLVIVVQTSGLVFNKEGFLPQQQTPYTYTAGIRIDNQKGYFVVGGSVRNSDALKMAVGDAGGSRQVVNVPVPEPYNPRNIKAIETNNGFVIVSLGHN